MTLECFACAATRRAEKRLDALDGIYSYARRRPPHSTRASHTPGGDQ